MTKSLLLGFVAAVVAMPGAQAQLIDSYNADTLSQGSLNSWTDLTGTQNATNSNGLAAPTVTNAGTVFNGHNYVNFGAGAGVQTASALFSGNSSRSVVAVYATPFGDTEGKTGQNGIAANDVDPIAGEASGPGDQGELFILQSRDSGSINGAVGDPYLAGFADDIASPGSPVANRLTFSIAAYDAATSTETLYWAYGLTGAVNSISKSVASHFNGTPGLDTYATPFTIGFDNFGEASLGNMNVAQVQVYQNGLNSVQAATEIGLLQTYYGTGVPEPSTFALVGAGLLAGMVFLRRRILA